MIRYVLRPPSFGSTPKRLKRLFNALRTVKIPNRNPIEVDWHRDFFLAYPPTEIVVNAPESYPEMRALYASNKLQQRQWLDRQGFPVPLTYTRLHQPFGRSVEHSTDRQFVVRPLRHFAGAGYRLTSNTSDFNPQTEYLSEVFPKRWEYRVILSYGKPIATLLKKFIRDPANFTQPWNHANGAYFVTCHNYRLNRLRWTNLYDLIESCSVLKQFHLVALDVLLGNRRLLGLDHHPYAICELNFCPSLTIPANLEALRAHVVNRS